MNHVSPKTFLTRRLRRFGLICRVATDLPSVALTFDDGPDPTYTPQLLEVLSRHGAKATFFLDGPAATRHPELVTALRADGHVVAVHGWKHKSAQHDGSVAHLRNQIDEIRRGAEAISHVSRLYRPPYGHESRWTRVAALILRYQMVYWSASIADWEARPSEVLANRLRAEIQPGAVILLHDRLRHAVDPAAFDRSALVLAVDEVLQTARDGFEFVTIPELLRVGRPVVRFRRRPAPPLAPMTEQLA